MSSFSSAVSCLSRLAFDARYDAEPATSQLFLLSSITVINV
jgi:hypothetical protein